MKKVIITILFFSLLPIFSLLAQTPYYTQSFETIDSTSLPQGWSKWNMRWYQISPYSNWTVRDTGRPIPWIGGLSKAKDGKRSIMVSWGASIDTGSHPMDTSALSDAWLVTKQFRNVPSDAFMMFWACGGRQSPSYLADSLQIWVSTGDSLPSSFTHYIETEFWITGFTYGNFQNYYIDLSSFAGQNIRVGFRYYMDCAVDGYCVFMDKFEMYGTVGINQIGTNIPKSFALQQNYPNPFNPVTHIKFDIPKNTTARIEVFNNLGQVVKFLHDGHTNAGYYETDFDASSLSSGMYYYRLTTPDYVETKKMVLVK